MLDEAQAIKNPVGTSDEGGQAAEDRLADRVDRHAGGESSVRPVVAVRFSLPWLARSAAEVQEVCQSRWRAATARPLRAASPARRALHPASAEDRQVRSSPICPTRRRSRPICGLSKRQAALYDKAGRANWRAQLAQPGGHPTARSRAVVPDAVQADLQSPQPTARRRPTTPRTRAVSFERLAEICEEIASRQEKALVFTQFREMTEPSANHLGRRLRSSGAGSARRHGGRKTQEAGRPISARRRDRRSLCCH